MSDPSGEVTAALVSLAESNIPVDIQELLVRGNPTRSIPPGALYRALVSARVCQCELAAQFCDEYAAENRRIADDISDRFLRLAGDASKENVDRIDAVVNEWVMHLVRADAAGFLASRIREAGKIK